MNFIKLNEKIILSEKTRIDKIIFDNFEFSRSKAAELIKKGMVKVNYEVCLEPSKKFSEIDSIEIDVPEPEKMDLTPKYERRFEIVYEDEDLMVINKPAGVTVHPGAGNHNDTLVNELLGYSELKLSTIGGEFRPGIVHRLDKDTSGLMIIAKNDFAHMHLSDQLKSRELTRCYYALCYSVPAKMKDTIKTQIARDPVHRKQMKVVEEGGKVAITEYEVLKVLPKAVASIINCKLKTGRTHQIRVHMTYIGNSIIGDPIYKSRGISRYQNQFSPEFRENIKNLNRQALHAYKIAFIHPRSMEYMEFTSELPDDLLKLTQI